MFRRIAGLLLLLSFCAAGALGAASPYRIAVIKSRTLPPYDAAVEGIVEKLKEKGVKPEFSSFDLQGDMKNAPAVLRKMRDYNPRQILAVGTLAAQAARTEAKNIPVVFTMVLNPVASGLAASFSAAGGNVTGVSLDIPLEEQFANFRLVVPQARRIGVLYNPLETGLVVYEAKSAAERQGLTLVPIPVDSPLEVPRKLEQLRGTDGLWMTADSVVFTPRNTEYILLFTLKEKIPFMGVSPAFVKAGALFAKEVDLDLIYAQTAERMARIMEGEEPGEMAVGVPQKVMLVLNLETARTITLNLSPAAVRGAKELIGGN